MHISIFILYRVVVLHVRRFITRSTDRTLHPVNTVVFIYNRIIVCNGTDLTTHVTSCITSIIMDVGFTSGLINITTDRAFHPVLSSALILNGEIVSDGTNITTYVTIGITGVIVDVVRNCTNFSTDITIGIASIVIYVIPNNFNIVMPSGIGKREIVVADGDVRPRTSLVPNIGKALATAEGIRIDGSYGIWDYD